MPAVAMDADGDAIVTWQSNFQRDFSVYDLYAQRFNSVGVKVGDEFQINTSTTFSQSHPAVALDADGDTFISWTSDGQDLNNAGIFSQRFRSPNPVPKVAYIQINDGSPQRSMVTSVQIMFDSPVTFVGPAFTLVNNTTGSPVNLTTAVDALGMQVTLTFVGGSVDLGGSLSDGRYTLTIVAVQFTGNGFDGDGDGISGDNYILASAPLGLPATNIFRIFGDGDGDGSVTSIDFGLFRQTFGTGLNLAFDFNGDGNVSSNDFAEFRMRFGVTI